MPITFSCPNPECPRIFSVKDEFGGRTSKCPDCGTNILVPATQATPIPVPLPVSKDVFCTNCGNSVSEQAIACMSCGAKPIGHKKFCRQCGVGLNPEQVVCVKCGSKVDAGGFQSFINNAAEGLQSLGKGASQSTSSGSFPITLGEKLIFGAIVLALFSFFLPWVEGPMPRQNGIVGYAFLFGGVFIFPGWMVAKKMRTNTHKVGGYICAGIGLCLALMYKWMFITSELKRGLARRLAGVSDYVQREAIREAYQTQTQEAFQLINLGIGAYLFILACIALIVGIALIDRN